MEEVHLFVSTGSSDTINREDDVTRARHGWLGTIARYLALLAATAWGILMFYWGGRAIATQSFVNRLGQRQSGPWFPKPLHGAPAVFAGLSLICAAVALLSIYAVYGPLGLRLPRWARYAPWLFFAAWFVLMSTANHLAE